jgi:hypothetical protein
MIPDESGPVLGQGWKLFNSVDMFLIGSFAYGNAQF